MHFLTTLIQPLPRNHPHRFNPPLPIFFRCRRDLKHLLLGPGHATHQLRIGRLELHDAVIECRIGFGERRKLGLQRCRFASLEIGNTCCSVGICVKKETQKHTCSAKSALTIFASHAWCFMISVMSTSSLASASLASILWNEVEERGLQCECERERERGGCWGGTPSTTNPSVHTDAGRKGGRGQC